MKTETERKGNVFHSVPLNSALHATPPLACSLCPRLFSSFFFCSEAAARKCTVNPSGIEMNEGRAPSVLENKKKIRKADWFMGGKEGGFLTVNTYRQSEQDSLKLPLLMSDVSLLLYCLSCRVLTMCSAHHRMNVQSQRKGGFFLFLIFFFF